MLRTRGAFNILNSTRASRHNGLHFCNSSTSKSAPTMFCTFWLAHVLRASGVHFFNISTCQNTPRLRCLEHFDFKMCFAPQPDFGVPFLIPSDCSHLCFSICQYCQKFDFKTSFYHHHTHTHAHTYIYISIYLSIYLYLHTCTSPDVPGRSCWMPTRRVRRMWRSQTTIVAWSESAIFGSDGPPGRWGFLRNIK